MLGRKDASLPAHFMTFISKNLCTEITKFWDSREFFFRRVFNSSQNVTEFSTSRCRCRREDNRRGAVKAKTQLENHTGTKNTERTPSRDCLGGTLYGGKRTRQGCITGTGGAVSGNDYLYAVLDRKYVRTQEVLFNQPIIVQQP